MNGLFKMKTQLTAKLFEPKDSSLDAEFLNTHPVTTNPELYREIKKGKRIVDDKCITTAFVNFAVDSLQSTQANWVNFKYHDSGIGTGGELIGDTTLGTPWGGSRSVGTQIEGSTANIYKTVATTTYTNSKAITEHGLFNQSSSGTLMDRSTFSAINVVSGNQIEWTYELTISAGG